MLTTQLTFAYFDNKVRTVPKGSGRFFDAIENIDAFTDLNDNFDHYKEDLDKLMDPKNSITILMATGCGENKVEELVENLLEDFPPDLLDKKQTKAYVILSSDKELSEDEITEVTSPINDLIDPDVTLIYWNSIDENLMNSIKATVIIGVDEATLQKEESFSRDYPIHKKYVNDIPSIDEFFPKGYLSAVKGNGNNAPQEILPLEGREFF